MTTKRTLRDLAASTPAGTRDRRNVSAVDSIPGLKDDLAATIADENAKSPKDRHTIKALYRMACELHPELKDRIAYNGFWKYVTKTFKYHGGSQRGA